MTDLITRIEQADGPRRELFEEAQRLLRPRPNTSSAVTYAQARAMTAWHDRFDVMLNVQAWTSAVEMLVPEGWRIASLYQDAGEGTWVCALANDAGRFGNAGSRCYAAAHPSLALLAAILRAERNEP